MNALTLLAAQHEEVDELIAEIRDAAEEETKRELFAELADCIAAHSEIEEQLFYPSVKAPETEALLSESAKEHMGVKKLLAELLQLDVAGEEFGAKLDALEQQLQHHAHEEEEGKLFPLVEKKMSTDQLETLGAELETMFDELVEEDPRRQVPSQAGVAADV